MTTATVKIPSPKGNLAAVIHYSKTKTGRLAILCPGNVDSKDYTHLVGLADELTKRGYTVVRFDPTGTWGSDGNISDYTTTQYLKDIKNVLNFMLKQSPYKHILLGGHSRGGQVSILYAARDPRISLVLGIMPSSNRTFTASRRAEWKKAGVHISLRDIPGKTGRKEFRIPYSHVEDRDKYDVIKDVTRVHVPLVLITGELDTIVLPKYVKEIFDHAHEPKRFLAIADIGHDYRHNAKEIKTVNEGIIKELATV